MTVYVTGSSGFIGSNLVKKLDNHASIPHFDIQKTDFSDADKVFFLSAYGNMSTHENEKAIIRANVTDLVHVANSVNWDKIQSFVFLSTSSVKLKVQTMYSRTKKAAEEVLLAYMEKYHAPVTIIRPLSVTGVGEQEAHLIPTLIRSILDDKPITLSPNPKHDFIDVSDVVDGILNLSNNHAKGIYELGTGISTSNKEVLNIVEKEIGKKGWVTIQDNMRAYDNEEWMSTNFRSRGWGWFPQKTLDESIKEMVDAAKQAREKGN